MNLIEHPRLEHLSNTYNIKTWTDTGKEIIIIS